MTLQRKIYWQLCAKLVRKSPSLSRELAVVTLATAPAATRI